MSDVNIYEKFRRYDELDIRILDCIYNKEITVMQLIIRRLMFMAHRVTISRRIKAIEKDGLIEIIQNTNPICFKISQNQERVKNIINELKKVRGLI